MYLLVRNKGQRMSDYTGIIHSSKPKGGGDHTQGWEVNHYITMQALTCI